MKLTTIPFTELPLSIRQLASLMGYRSVLIRRAYLQIGYACFFGVVSGLLYLWVFMQIIRVQPVWGTILGILTGTIGAFVARGILFHETEHQPTKTTKKRWSGFAIFLTIITLPVFFLAHAVRFQHIVDTQFPDPFKDPRYELFQELLQQIVTWNRLVPVLNQILFVQARTFNQAGESEERVSEQAHIFLNLETELRFMARQMHAELVVHPIGSANEMTPECLTLLARLKQWGSHFQVRFL